MLLRTIRSIQTTINNHTSTFLLLGLAGVAWHNWRLWQRDRVLAKQTQKNSAPVPIPTRSPKVSVLVAAWNESKHIDKHLESFLQLAYPDIELVICAGGNDSTFERTQRFANERILVLEQYSGEGKQHALARCFERASGEIFYLTDADCIYDQDTLSHLLHPLIHEGEHAATGSSRPLPEQENKILPRYLWSIDVMANTRNMRYSDGLLGRNAAVSLCALKCIGGLDFVADTGTDYQLARRLLDANIAIRYVGSSVIASDYPQTLGVYRHKQSRWLRNLIIYGWRSGAWQDIWRTSQTMAIGLLMIVMPWMAVIFGPIALAVWCLGVIHATLCKLRYVCVVAHSYHLHVSLRLISSLLPLTLIDFCVWALPIFDLLHPKRRTRW